MKSLTKAFHEPVGVVYHGGALLYALAAYGFGWYGLISGGWLAWIVSVLLLGHGMVIEHPEGRPRNAAPPGVGRYRPPLLCS